MYAESVKAIMNEEFGDGIMSAIDMFATVKKVEGKAGEARVCITLNGKVSIWPQNASLTHNASLTQPHLLYKLGLMQIGTLVLMSCILSDGMKLSTLRSSCYACAVRPTLLAHCNLGQPHQSSGLTALTPAACAWCSFCLT